MEQQKYTAKRAPRQAKFYWAQDDRQWFSANPGRSHRLRMAYPGEWPNDRDGACTAVQQMAVGLRCRLPYLTVGDWPPPETAPEEVAWAVFNSLTAGADRDFIPGVEIAEQMRSLEHGGRA